MAKQLFNMSDEQWAAMMQSMTEASNSRVMYLSGGTPMFDSPQEIANRAWKKLGEEMGFVWDSASQGPTERSFYATSSAEAAAQREAMAEAYSPRMTTEQSQRYQLMKDRSR